MPHTIRCLKEVVESGTRRFPLFIGFVQAEDLARLAEVPSFRVNTANSAIARNVLDPPVEDWQRPLDRGRVERIGRQFSRPGTLMPNPVLLSENPYYPRRARITQERVSGSLLAPTFNVDVGDPEDGRKSLWILDGQHRINGMARSHQRASSVPVVLLLDDGAEAYTPEDFAEFFAQVTTSAQKLDDLHNEWLTFAFGLGDYGTEATGPPDARRLAFRAVAELCARRRLSGRGPNPFHNAIQFNHSYLPQEASLGGFSFTCIDLRKLIFSHYYHQASAPLAPEDIADELGKAYLALSRVVAGPLEESVFFGVSEEDVTYGQPYMQAALIVGVLSHLRTHGAPDDWEDVYRGLSFQDTNWNFTPWTRSFTGAAGTTSQRLAIRVFAHVFTDRVLPAGNLADYLKGDGARVTLMFSRLDENGRLMPLDRDEYVVLRGGDTSYTSPDRRHVKVAKLAETDGSRNIGRLSVLDKNDIGSRRLERMAGPGIVLDETFGQTVGRRGRQLQVRFLMEHYGGLTSEGDLTVSW